MHPDIADFANRKFYAKERLECVPLAHQLEETLAYNEASEDETDELLKAHRMIFIPSKPCRQLNISEKVNMEEARIITDLLKTTIPTTWQGFRCTEICWGHCAL